MRSATFIRHVNKGKHPRLDVATKGMWTWHTQNGFDGHALVKMKGNQYRFIVDVGDTNIFDETGTLEELLASYKGT